MPVDLEAPRKEASSFSFDDINTLLDQMSDKEKAYSLRARSSVQAVDGKQEQLYLVFLRNGNESVFERLDNWWNAKAQHALVKQLICAALTERGASPAPGQTPLRTVVHERALLRVRKMDKMAPEKIRAIFSECVAAEREIQVFQNRLSSLSSEDRLKFQEFNQHVDAILDKGKTCPAFSLLVQNKSVIKDPITELLAEAESHYFDAILPAFMQFTKAAAENRPMNEIDLALVLAFFDKWKTVRQPSRRAETANLAVADGESTAACRTAIDVLVDLCDRLRCASSPVAQATPGGDRTAVVPVPPRPPAPRSFPRPHPASLPVRPAILFQSLSARSGARSAGAVYAAAQVLMPVAKRVASRARVAAAPASAAMRPVRTAAPAPAPIRPARSPQDISCDCQAELDMSDIDGEAVILIVNEGGLFSLSPACHQWLAELGGHQHVQETHFVKVQYQAQTVLLARAQRAPMHGHLDAAAICKLGEIYEAAVATAIGQNRPICLTDLFDYDPHTAGQCVEAMLAPIRRCYREGMQPAIHIRVASSRLRETIVAALKVLLSTPPAERPAVEVIDCLTEADRQLPGLIMISRDSADREDRTRARHHARRTRSAAGAAAASQVGPRKLLGSDTTTHLYFFARPCPLKDGLPDGARIAGEYAALFQAARQHRCKLVTLEVLSETPEQEVGLVAALSAAIIAARDVTPELKVRIVTRNEKIRNRMQSCFQ